MEMEKKVIVFLGTVSATFRVFAEDDSLVQRSLQRGLIPYVMSYIMIKQMRWLVNNILDQWDE